MAIQLGQIAPDFEQDSTHGPIHFYDWLGSSWVVLISHPKEFTSICVAELREMATLLPEWNRRGVKPIMLSVGPVEAHPDIDETHHTTLDLPIIADVDAKVSTLYGVVHPESRPTVTVRSVFVIDPVKKVRLILTYPSSAAERAFAEVLRKIDSLQLADAFDPVI